MGHLKGASLGQALTLLGRSGVYPREGARERAPQGQTPTLLTNNRISQKGLPEADNLAYYEHSQDTAEKVV